MLGLTAAVAVITFVPAVGELVVRLTRVSGEFARKLVHAASGVAAATLPLLVSYREIVALGVAFAVVMLVVHRFRLLAALDGVERTSYGDVWFPLGFASLAALFPSAVAYVYGTLVLGLADAAAALVGVRIGGRRLPIARGKTFSGSAAFCAVALAVGFAVAGTVSMPLVVAASVLTCAEALASRGADNAVVPILAGLLATRGWA